MDSRIDILAKLNTAHKRNDPDYDFRVDEYMRGKCDIIKIKLPTEEITCEIDNLIGRSEHDEKNKNNRSTELFWNKKCGKIYKSFDQVSKVAKYDVTSLDNTFRKLNKASQQFADKMYEIFKPERLSFREISSLVQWNDDTYGYTHSIDIMPLDEQKIVLENLAVAWKKAYNICSEIIFHNYLSKEVVELTNGFKLTKHTLNEDAWGLRQKYIINPSLEYEKSVSDTLKEILPGSMYQEIFTKVVANYKSAISNLHVDFKMLSMDILDNTTMSFSVHPDGCRVNDKSLGLMPRNHMWDHCPIKGYMALNMSKYEREDLGFTNNERVTKQIYRNELGKWKLGVFITNHACPNTSDDLAAFDPGIKKFMVIADSTGAVYEVDTAFEKMLNKLKSLYSAQEKYSDPTVVNNPKKKKGIVSNMSRAQKLKTLDRQIIKLQKKIHNQVEDYHCKLAKMLALKYRAIVAPELSRFVAKCKGVTRLIMRHGNFSYRLRNACNTYGSTYLFSREDYTSKTCGSCGKVEGKSKGISIDDSARILTCSCGNVVDRDVNGAKNIFCRFISN